ncbi:MAG: replication initiator protein A [Sarcina sp.]
MSNFITAFDLKVASFYKFPKELMGKDYNSMKLESKMAYTILLDRASLSIINGWVNDKGEIYVKIKRKVLMELLSIKGTQKITVVMDELASYGLIFEKKAGFERCNENEVKELLLVAKGNVYILDLAHEILMKTNKKIHNFIAYMKALIKIIPSV